VKYFVSLIYRLYAILLAFVASSVSSLGKDVFACSGRFYMGPGPESGRLPFFHLLSILFRLSTFQFLSLEPSVAAFVFLDLTYPLHLFFFLEPRDSVTLVLPKTYGKESTELRWTLWVRDLNPLHRPQLSALFFENSLFGSMWAFVNPLFFF